MESIMSIVVGRLDGTMKKEVQIDSDTASKFADAIKIRYGSINPDSVKKAVSWAYRIWTAIIMEKEYEEAKKDRLVRECEEAGILEDLGDPY